MQPWSRSTRKQPEGAALAKKGDPLLTPYEGKVSDDETLNEIPKEYLTRSYVPGLAEVAAGVRFSVPTTIYVVSGDDTSGVAGVLLPSGEFIKAASLVQKSRFFEFSETDRYVQVVDVDQDGNYFRRRVIGDSWREGEVVWNGGVNGSVDPLSLDGSDVPEEQEDEPRFGPINRRTWEVNLTGPRQTTGELWKAIRRGTSQAGGREDGKQHLVRAGHGENSWDTFGGRREAA